MNNDQNRLERIEKCEHATLKFRGYFMTEKTVWPHLCKMYTCPKCYDIVSLCVDAKGIPTVHEGLMHIKANEKAMIVKEVL